jgi:TRAP-type C4-dicarboxylate transport system permease small subunit
MSHGANGEGATDAPPPSLPERLVTPVARLGLGLAALGVLIVLAVTGYSVFKRYVLGTPVTWTDELSGYLVVAIVMFGAAETLQRGDHISVDLLTGRLRSTGRRLAAVWGMIAAILVMLAILVSGITAVRFSYDFGVYSDGYLAVPMWIPQLALIFGSVLLIAVAAARLISILTGGRGN